MGLLEQLKAFEGGYLVDLERGPFLAVFIGKFERISVENQTTRLTVAEADLYRLNGLVIDRNRRFDIYWDRTMVAPSVPIETSQRLSFMIPYLAVSLVIYRPDLGISRPEFAQALADLQQIHYF